MSSLKQEYFACLALRHTPGLGPRTWSAVLNNYPGAYAALKDCARWPALHLASAKCAENAGRELWRSKAESEYREALRLGFGILPWSHPMFPSSLKEIPDPPVYLYYYGDPSLLLNPAVGIVGTRKSSPLGLEYVNKIAGELSVNGITVVSGFARGIDSTAHESALNGVGSTIAVLGTGLDFVDYPADSSGLRQRIVDKGLVLSEFPPGTRPYAGNFPFRNRIISGLSLGVLVTEADITSGSLITARLAAEQGREVMALPGPVGDKRFSGCLKLIKEGAALVESAEDVLINIRHCLGREDVASTVRESPLTAVSDLSMNSENNNMLEPEKAVDIKVDLEALEPAEAQVAAVLERDGRLHIDEIAHGAGLASPVVSALLVGLEIKGVVVRFPGMYYDLKCC